MEGSNDRLMHSNIPILHSHLVSRSHGFHDRSKSISFHQTDQASVDPFDRRRPLINKTGVDLHGAGTGFNFFIGIVGRKDSTDADDGDLSAHGPIKMAHKGSR